MQALNVVFMGLLTGIAAIDYRTLKVPFWSLGAVLVLAIFKGFMFVDLLQGFCLMLLSLLVSDKILGRETVGGGDLWLGTAMSCFMGFDKFFIAYTVAAILGCLAMFTIYRNHRTLDVAYVPFMAYGAFWAMFIAR